MTITSFQDLLMWQKARQQTKNIYGLTSKEKFSRDFGLKDQIQRAAVSVMSNIAEGFTRRSDKEFLQFLFVSLSSNAEVQSQLFVALDLGYIQQTEFDDAYNFGVEISKMTSKFIQHLRKND